MGINVYMYVYGCVCGSLYVVDGQGIILNIFEVVSECVDISLSILAQRPHKELCLQKPVKLEERMTRAVREEWDSRAESWL